MKIKELEIWLSQCEPFYKPKVHLEQYATSGHIAARMIYASQHHIDGAVVADLGSGCGILSIGAVMAGATYVCGLEIDGEAISTAIKNTYDIFEDGEDAAVNFVQTEITLKNDSLSRFSSLFDVVVMNPPFGTKNNGGADLNFLKAASFMVRKGGHIYSLHKSSTRGFFEKKLLEENVLSGVTVGGEVPFAKLKGEVLAEVQFDLPRCYRFHREKIKDIAVDFWHFEKL